MSRLHLSFYQIRQGAQDRFRYHGDLFLVTQNTHPWIITRLTTGDTAHCTFLVTQMPDLWNIADCLQRYENHLYIDEDYVIHLLQTTNANP